MGNNQIKLAEMGRFVERQVLRQMARSMRVFPFRSRRPKESYARYEKTKRLHWAFQRKVYTIEAQQKWIQRDFKRQGTPRRKMRTRRR